MLSRSALEVDQILGRDMDHLPPGATPSGLDGVGTAPIDGVGNIDLDVAVLKQDGTTAVFFPRQYCTILKLRYLLIDVYELDKIH